MRMQSTFARFAILAAILAVTGCQSGGGASLAKSWWPWGGKKKLDTSALAATTKPTLPSQTTTPGSSAGSLAKSGAGTTSPYPDFSGGQASYPQTASTSAGGYPGAISPTSYPPYSATPQGGYASIELLRLGLRC